MDCLAPTLNPAKSMMRADVYSDSTLYFNLVNPPCVAPISNLTALVDERCLQSAETAIIFSHTFRAQVHALLKAACTSSCMGLFASTSHFLQRWLVCLLLAQPLSFHLSWEEEIMIFVQTPSERTSVCLAVFRPCSVPRRVSALKTK